MKAETKINRKTLARIFRAVSNEKRIMILQSMRIGINKINDISLNTALPYKTVERHLKILVAAGIAQQNRCGMFFHFHLNDTPHHNLRHHVDTVLTLIDNAR